MEPSIYDTPQSDTEIDSTSYRPSRPLQILLRLSWTIPLVFLILGSFSSVLSTYFSEGETVSSKVFNLIVIFALLFLFNLGIYYKSRICAVLLTLVMLSATYQASFADEPAVVVLLLTVTLTLLAGTISLFIYRHQKKKHSKLQS